MVFPIPPIVIPITPTTNITPFTYRDGLTYLQRLERIVGYINKKVIPWVNESYEELAESTQDQINILIAQVNEIVEQIINSSVELQDIVLEQIINDDESLSRIALDNLYTKVTDFNNLIDNINSNFEEVDTKFNEINIAHTGIVNAKSFGVIGDGIADDTENMQNAIYAAEGMTLFIPQGVYSVGALEVRSNTKIYGYGECTFTHRSGGISNTFPRAMITAENRPEYRSPGDPDRISIDGLSSNIHIDGIIFQGNAMEVWGIQFIGANDFSISNVKIVNTKGGIDLRATKRGTLSDTHLSTIREDGYSLTDQNFLGDNTEDIVFSRCIVEDSCWGMTSESTGMCGFEFDDGPRRITFRDCIARNNLGAGFRGHVHDSEYTITDILFENCHSINNYNASIPGALGGFELGQCPSNGSIARITYRDCVSRGSKLAFARLPGAQTGVVENITIDGGYWESRQAPSGRTYLESTCIYVGKNFKNFIISNLVIAGAVDGYGVYTYDSADSLTIENVRIQDCYSPLDLRATGSVTISNVVARPGSWVSTISGVCVYITTPKLKMTKFDLVTNQANYSSPMVRLIALANAILELSIENSGTLGGNGVTLQDPNSVVISGSQFRNFTNGVFFAGTIGTVSVVGSSFAGSTNKFNSTPASLATAGNVPV